MARQSPDLAAAMREIGAATEAALDRLLPRPEGAIARLDEAMRYACLGGGKRLRAVLCVASADLFGVPRTQSLRAAAAIEMLHAYSLAHDDLPCMDDDDMRRGRPTSHKVFGEAVAVLAGDALQAIAFEAVSRMSPAPGYTGADYVLELALAAGSRQLIAGQVMDLEGEGKTLTFDQLRAIHERKTAALLTCCLRLGAMSAGAEAASLEALTRFGHSLGLAFQVIDDILDVTQTSEQLGKTAGKDIAAAKATYPSLLGLDAARAEAARLTAEAHEALASFGAAADPLRAIADHLLARKY